MARPKKEINRENFEKLCSIQCTEKEICDFLDITDKTLTRWCKEVYNAPFSEVYEAKSAIGKISLRRAQFRLAERNATMAIWLGKQYLNQREVYEIEGGETLEKARELLAGVQSAI